MNDKFVFERRGGYLPESVRLLFGLLLFGINVKHTTMASLCLCLPKIFTGIIHIFFIHYPFAEPVMTDFLGRKL